MIDKPEHDELSAAKKTIAELRQAVKDAEQVARRIEAQRVDAERMAAEEIRKAQRLAASAQNARAVDADRAAEAERALTAALNEIARLRGAEIDAGQDEHDDDL